MTPTSLPEKVDALLRDHLKSFEQLEVLLLLRFRSTESWTAVSAGTELRLNPDLLQDALAGLEGSRLVQRLAGEPARYQYHARTRELAAAVDELVDTYSGQRAAVMSQMSTNAIERIRSGSLKAWADAFVIRKSKDDG